MRGSWVKVVRPVRVRTMRRLAGAGHISRRIILFEIVSSTGESNCVTNATRSFVRSSGESSAFKFQMGASSASYIPRQRPLYD